MPLADDQGGAQQGEADELEGVAWSGKSVGGGRLMQLAGRVAKAIGPAGVEGLAHAISPLVVTGGGDLRTICCEYARRIFPKASHSSHLAFMRQHLSHFASILADRALALRGGDDDFLLVGRNIEHCVKAVRADEGCILISAHVGNWELGGRMLRDLGGPPVSLVKVEAEDPREREAVAQALYGNGRRPSIIDPRDGLRASLAIRAALEAGETVCMLGDRVYGAQESIQVPFLGSMARFPAGPWQVAALTGVPVIPCFMMRSGRRRYLLDVCEPIRARFPRKRSGRRQIMVDLVRHWAGLLERQLRRDPRQWHNFYDFWSESN